MLFVELARTSAALATASARRAKIELLADCLRRLPGDELAAGVSYLAGQLRQRQIGVGGASLRRLPDPAPRPTLSVAAVDTALARIGAEHGPGTTARRGALLAELFAAATADEQRLLRGLLTGEVRQGAAAGVLTEALAAAHGIAPSVVRRALLLSGDLRAVALAAHAGGAAALAAFRLAVGRPLAPMLAAPAASVAEACRRLSPDGAEVAVDDKLDGIRVQVHRDGDDVAVFTRSLDDITDRVPEIVAVAAALPARRVVLDGEALALTDAGRPEPFQVTAGRVGRHAAGSAGSAGVLHPFFFDVLHVDGADLLDEPARVRFAELARVVGTPARVGRRHTGSAEQVARRLTEVLAAGHEGVVVKSLTAPYEAGRRGGGWLKVKPRHTLDLVVLAAEWGHGRRRGWLSNLHLGAADGAGGFAMLGKTFRGLTDRMLAWQTDRLLALATDRGGHLVRVRPELVVEVAFDGVQSSPRYPAGLTLRFARVLRFRSDKTAAQADTVESVHGIWQAQRGGG